MYETLQIEDPCQVCYALHYVVAQTLMSIFFAQICFHECFNPGSTNTDLASPSCFHIAADKCPPQAGNNPGINCFRISQIQRVFSEVCAELLLVSVYGDRPAGGSVVPEKKSRPRGDGAEDTECSGGDKTEFSLLGWAAYSHVRKVGTT